MDDERRVPDDDTELTRVTPPDDETRIMPPADEGETQVMPGGETEATRVMPAADEPPPPPPAQPTLLMTHGRPERPGVPWWVWLVVVLAVIAAAAALWYFFLRPTDSDAAGGEEFVGTWSPQTGAGGGLVIKQLGDGRFTVTQYDGDLQQAGSSAADLVDGRLELSIRASAIGLKGVTGTVRGTLTHEPHDRLRLDVTAGDLSVEPVYYVRVEVLLPASPMPTPTVSVSPTPTANPTGTPTASPSPTGSPSADQQVVANIAKLQAGIVAWAAENDNLYPSPQDVIQGGGLSQYVDPWPTNPFTGAPMTPGTSPGSYVYEQLSGGQAYKLTGYLGNGLTYTVP
ncbi:MAG: DUF3597 domain-containing protein [Actinobacteria bacterium]|nr:DUF3597 domain-containing protein [Actinomycetota bacterium]